MFSNKLRYAYENRANSSGYVSQTGVEDILRKNMGYSFNRHFISDLLKPYTGPNGQQTTMIAPAVNPEAIRPNYSIETVIDLLAYLMLSESIKGMIRGNVKEDRIKSLTISKLTASIGGGTMKQLAYTADVRQENIPMSKNGVAPSSYNPCEHGRAPMDLNARCSVGYFFIYHWIKNSNHEDFYENWHIFRDRVLCEDPLSEEGTGLRDDNMTAVMKPFKEDVKFTLPFLNRYQARLGWASQSLAPLASTLNSHNGASLASSIEILDSFIKCAKAQDVEKLRDWMEIILMYENGSGWVVEEARAALKREISLDLDRLIDDWWLLSFVYLRSITRSL